MPQSLAVRYAKTGTVGQVFRNNNGVLTQIGNNVDLISNGDDIDNDITGRGSSNLGIGVGGQLLATFNAPAGSTQGQVPYAYDPSTGDWVKESGTTATIPSVGNVGGMYVGRGPSGVLRIAIPIRVNGGSNCAFIYKDVGTTTWTVSSQVLKNTVNLDDTNPWTNGVVFQNQLHVGYAKSVFIFDFGTAGVTRIDLPSGAGNNSIHFPFAWVRAKARLFLFWVDTNNSGSNNNLYADLYEYAGGNYVERIDGSAIAATFPQNNATGDPGRSGGDAFAAHYDETNDRIIYHGYQQRGGGSSGWRAYAIDPDDLTTSGVTEITGTIVPVQAFPSGLVTNDVHYFVETDNVTDPANPVTYVWFLVDDGTWARFTYNGTGSVMTSGGSGGDRGVALSHGPWGMGQYYYNGSTTANPAHQILEAQNRLALPGRVRVYFTLYTIDETGGSPTIPDLNVEWRYGTVEEVAELQGTISAVGRLSGAGSIPSLNGNVVQGCTADGTTIYFLDWEAVADGVQDTEFHLGNPRIIP